MDKIRATPITRAELLRRRERCLFDTSILISSWKAGPGSVFNDQWVLSIPRARRRISIISRFEFLVGLWPTQTPERERRRREEWLGDTFDVDSLTAGISERFDRLLKQRLVLPQDLADALIAATALMSTAIVISSDRFFEGIPSLLVAKPP